MSDTPKDIARLMKRCQIGVGGRHALDEAHSILAECYGTLGALQAEVEALRKGAELYRWLRDTGSLAFVPFRSQWGMDAEHCDAAIDNEMARQRMFGAA